MDIKKVKKALTDEEKNPKDSGKETQSRSIFLLSN